MNSTNPIGQSPSQSYYPLAHVRRSPLILPWMARARMSPASVQVVALLVLLPVVAGLFYLAVGVLHCCKFERCK